MKQTETKRLRGFTLMEMIVVLGIIAIISAIFIPAVNGYLTRSRLNTSNAQARVIFNSLQTICQEFEFVDRNADTSMLYGNRTDSNGTMLSGILVMKGENGHISDACRVVTRKGSTGVIAPSLESGAAVTGALDASTSTTTLMQRMIRLCEGSTTTTWMAYIEDYAVRGVVCAALTNSDYIGGYPSKSTARGGFSSDSSISSFKSAYSQTSYERRYFVHPSGSTYTSFQIHKAKNEPGSTTDADATNAAVAVSANYPEEGTIESIDDFTFANLIAYSLDSWD